MWDTVGLVVSKFVLHVLLGNPIPSVINETLLVLLPKVSNPKLISQFRPISLYNVLYKLITKTMVNRMKKVLSSLIRSEQSSFVPRRQIMDNVVVY